MLFIVVLALLIFGPKRLPEVGRTIGKGMAQFRKATSDLKRTIETEISLEEEPSRTPARPIGPPASQPRRIGPERPATTVAEAAPAVPASEPLPAPPTPAASPADESAPGESRPS